MINANKSIRYSSIDGLEPRTLRPDHRPAVTLLELLVVMTIMVATSLIVIPVFSNIQVTSPNGRMETPVEIATQATLTTVRDALVGKDGVLESLSHNSNALPRKINDLVREHPPEHFARIVPELMDYDPVNRVGWHGPYIFPTGKNEIGEPTVVDGWGNELQLQVDFNEDGNVDETESKYLRVVSAGPNGQFETPFDPGNMKPGKNQNFELTIDECGDDMVMFIRIPDCR